MADQTSSGGKLLEIRKYPNRRYYDTTRSQHVTLEEINRLIRDGYEIRVTDSKTGQDITAKVLAQIIFELDSPKLGIFPVPLLHRLIRANEQLVNDFVQKYFNQALSAFLESQRGFEHYLRQAMGLQSPSVPDWTKLMWGPLAPGWTSRRNQGAAGTGNSQEPQPSSPAASPADAAREAQELRQQVEALRHQIESLQQQAAEPRKKARPRRGRSA